ncbi:DivIVA domain-containing protein [Nocardioides conyzicola]|uniref:DivIVA domain-containing protein n=1 Tax=Nocardioides conyzicola TaxID=1651781 RepID=A0ABP8Y2H6_9ACTN
MPTNVESLLQEIRNVRFRPVRLREGYDMGEVDQLLDQLTAALGSGQPVDQLVAAARFTPVRLREGYDMGDVDRFLAGIVEAATGGETTPAMYADPPPTPAVSPATYPAPSVIEEQRGLLSRLFGRG